jgi:hypothetical protein
MYHDRHELWLGFSGSVLYLIDSLVFLYGWYIDNLVHIEKGITTLEQGEMWNLFANIIFLISSLGYVITGINSIRQCCESFNTLFNFYLAALSVLDGFLYLLALVAGEHARSYRPENSVALFHSSIDWYLVATASFIVGSLFYLVAALSVFNGSDGSLYNLLGSIVFIFDSIFYLISALQYRDKDETPFIHRLQFLSIERKTLA